MHPRFVLTSGANTFVSEDRRCPYVTSEFVAFAETPNAKLGIASPRVLRDVLNGALTILIGHEMKVPAEAVAPD
jgi:hypothetical protein